MTVLPLSRRQLLYGILIGAAAIGVGLLWIWQPERQVRRHTAALLARAESKDWNGMMALIAEEYSDAWGHDRAEVVQDCREVLQQFFICHVEASRAEVREEHGIGTMRAHLRLTGRGGPLAEYAVERVSRLTQPFVFTWRQRSGKPWDWVLTSVEQAELKIGEN